MRLLPTTPRARTLAGLALGLAFVPVLVGITACLKTPIGDPGRAWLDPRLTGLWVVGDPGLTPWAGMLFLFEPWDDHTWLLTVASFEDAVGASGAETAGAEGREAAPVADAAAVARHLARLNDERARPGGAERYRAWLAGIRGRQFLVIEERGQDAAGRLEPPRTWFVMRVVHRGDRVELALIDPEVEDLGELKSRGPAEQVIARHAADPEFYEEPLLLYAVPEEARADAERAFDRAGAR